MPALTIPANPAAVTSAWITEVLRGAGALPAGVSVSSIEMEEVGAGIGVMGELARVFLNYDGPAADAPATVIVKSPSPFEANRAQGVSLGMYAAEIRFLTELASTTGARTAVTYLAVMDDETGDFVVVMEDLGHLVMGNQVDGVSFQQALAAVQVMADVHAGWWGRVQQPSLEWVPSVVHARIQGLAQMWPMLWEGFTANFSHALPDGGDAAGRAIRDNYWSIMSRLGEWTWTLLHQDFRVDNLFFDEANQEQPVVVIDWQGIGRGPGVYDLCYFLGGSLSVADRRTHEETLVRAYHDRLVAGGVSDYPFEQLWHDYRFGHLSSVSTAVLVGATFDVANERGKALVEALASRHFQAVVDLGSVDMLSELGA